MMRTWISVSVICCLAGSASALTIKATEAQIKTIGGASGGVWNLWSAGEVGEYIEFAGGGQYEIAVTAYGSPAGGVWPKMSLRFNGAAVGRINVTGDKPEVYMFIVKLPAKLPKAPVKVVVAFDNDAVIGKELHITEFTPTTSGAKITGSHVGGVWDESAQGEYAEKFFRICFAHKDVVALTWWDLCERGAWLKGGGLLHKDLSPKKVYTTLKKLLHEEWSTRAAGKSDAAGKFAFRGFHGTYTATVSAGGKTTKTEFHLGKKGPSAITIKLAR